MSQMDEVAPLTDIPLSNSNAQTSEPHLDTTYGRYERAPFRQYSEQKVRDQAPLIEQPRRLPSKDSLLRRVLSRQSRLERKVDGQQGNIQQHTKSGMNRKSSGKRPQPAYSLAGSRHKEGESSGKRSGPQWGLGAPFPQRQKKSKRGSQRGHPQGQVGGGPSGHHGARPPVRGQPTGETPGGPAANARNPDDEDEAGHTNYLEHFANWDNDEGGRNDSQETLTEEGDEEDEIPNWWFAFRRKMREPLAEWLATMVAVLMGTAGNLQVKVGKGEAGSFTQEAAMWGLGTMMAIYIAGGISGAHCNPTVSIFLSVFRGFPARKAFIYICAQIVGAICAVSIAYGIYKDAIMSLDPHKTTNGDTATGKSFYTLPATGVTPATAFMTDFVSAAVMGGTVLALGDDTNSPPGAGMHAFILGLVGFAMASTLGYNTGPQTNPAKDLASRLVPWWTGYGSPMWAKGWWAEAWVASITGGLVGCLIYDIAIFEGEESPINYSMSKRKESRRGNKRMWWKTGLFGRSKKAKGKQDLEEGAVGINEKGAGKKLDGH